MEKKPFYKKPITYILGGVGCLGIIVISFVLFIGLLFAIPTDEPEQVETDGTDDEEVEEVTEEKEEEPEEEPEEDEGDEKEEESIYEYTSLYEGEQTIEFTPGMAWSENSYFNTVYDSLEEVKKAFEENDEVTSVMVMINAEMIDNKGNEEMKPIITYRYTKETFNELNYDKFKELAIGEEWRILNESDGYFINPPLRDKLKDKYKDNLN